MVLVEGAMIPITYYLSIDYRGATNPVLVTDSIGNLKVTKRWSRRNVLRELHRSGVHRSSIGQLRGVDGRVLS